MMYAIQLEYDQGTITLASTSIDDVVTEVRRALETEVADGLNELHIEVRR